MTRSGLTRLTLFVFILFFSIVLVSAWMAAAVPPHALGAMMKPFLDSVRSMFRGWIQSSNLALRATGIFLNNVKLLGMAFISAGLFRIRKPHRPEQPPQFSPFWRGLGWVGLGWYSAIFIFNAVLAGMVVAVTSDTTGVIWPKVLVLGILPHGIFEVMAYASAFAVLIASIRPGGIKDRPLWWVVGPLVILLVAAFVEAGITPHLLGILHA